MENELSRVVDVLPGLVWTTLPDGRVDFVNQGWCEYTGLGRGDALGHAWQLAVHHDDLPGLLETWHSIRASGEPRDMQARLRNSNGEYRRFVLRVRPLPDAAGVRPKWCAIGTDIEDCGQAGIPGGTRGTDFQWIIDSIPALVAVMSPTGILETVNRHTLEYLGATLEELKDWTTADTVHPDDLHAVIDAWTRAVDTGEPYDVEHRIRSADGSYHWFHVRGLPLRDAEGRVSRWCVVEADIEDRKRDAALLAGEKQLLAQALEEVRSSEDRFRTAIDAMPGFVWSADPDGSVDFLNQRWCEYTGIPMGDALGNCWTFTIHPDDTGRLQAYWQDRLETGRPGEFEARLRRHDGTFRWFLIRTVPLRDAAGGIVKWYGQNTDIEDRKQAEILLAGEKRVLGLMAGGALLQPILEALCELVEATVGNCRCGIVLVDPRRNQFSHGVAPGLPDDFMQQVEGQPTSTDSNPWATAVASNASVVTGDLQREPRWIAWTSSALERGFTSSLAMPIPSKAGTVIGVLFVFGEQKAGRLPDQNLVAQFTHLAGIAIERAWGEAELKQSQAFLAKAQRLSSTGTFSWRVATGEITWSEEIYRIYELDPAIPATFELIDTRLHPDDGPSHNEMRRLQRESDGDFEHEHRLLMPDGRVKYLHLDAHATWDDHGQLEYIGAVQDVTERRLSEEALGRVRSELTHLARVATLGALTASIAHEVNQPLAGIITNANTCLRMLAADPPNVDGARETARRTIRDGNRASDVIKRLRALFAKKGATTEKLDLNAAAREVIAMLLDEQQRRGILLQTEFAGDLSPVMGDRVQLQQVILNLLLNAADAMDDVIGRPRRLLVRTEHDGEDHVRLTVRDSGAGFDPEDADRLFTAFYTTKGEGMGIGLSISRSIIESHYGRLWAMPNDGPGATFAFSIPCEPHVVANSHDDGAFRPDARSEQDHTVEVS